VFAWGVNSNGQLGNNTTTYSTTPVEVFGLGGVTSIAAGNEWSLAVQSNGGQGGFVWTWGANAYGQLGDATTTRRLIPVRVIGIDSAVQVAAGRDTGMARLADGAVLAWGYNSAGQLGDGSTVHSSVPVAAGGITNGYAITGRDLNSIIVDRLGLAWGLGKTVYCMFGAPTPYWAHVEGTPALVPGFTAGANAANGTWMSVLLKWDGSVWTTGDGYLGFGVLENHCAVRAIPSFSLAPNGWLLTDADGDGLPAWREYIVGTDPLDFDTNDNGVSDGIEAAQSEGDAGPDDDGDGIPNVLEIEAGTNPFNADSDGDGYNDRVDAFPLDPTRHDPPEPAPNDTTPPAITLTEPGNAVPRP